MKNNWIIITVSLVLALVGFLIALIVCALYKENNTHCQICSSKSSVGDIDLSEPLHPSVFYDLTMPEFQGLQNYLYSLKSLNLQRPDKAASNNSFIYLAELSLPPKDKVLRYLDKGGVQPAREAKVTIFRGDKPVPVVEEYNVGPLPLPSYHRLIPGSEAIPYIYRPMTNFEFFEIANYITNEIHTNLREMLSEAYGATLKDCNNRCLIFDYTSPFPPSVSGENARKVWFWLFYDIEYYILNPTDFAVLVKSDAEIYSIDKIWFNNHTYDSLQNLTQQYQTGTIKFVKHSFPSENQRKFSKAKRRKDFYTTKPLQNPIQIEADGKRYSIIGRKVKYMDWKFEFRMSSAYGPQVYDLRFKNERIAYEIGVQEIAMFYSGYNPFVMFADFCDSFDLIGPCARTLVPGSDCPTHATFLSVTHFLQGSEKPLKIKKGFCIFELNTGEPLRRHHEYSSFYEGMENVVLVLRSVLTVVNYDYVIDFVFYQNGVMNVKVSSTGYIVTSWFSEKHLKYGFRLHDRIIGNLHQHMFHFKADLDIKGITNRFETLDIQLDSVPNTWSKKQNSMYHQPKVTRNLRSSEKQAAYKSDFSNPQYFLFCNSSESGNYGNPHCYRILNRGITKQMLPEGADNEPSISWSRYQLAVTKRKEKEPHSSSQYSMFSAVDPVVNFQQFIDDDENIVDEDLVAWITLGLHHIPRTEDLPLTTTPGLSVSFFLLPYNYFQEDPAIDSKNAIRIEPGDEESSGVYINRYGVEDEVSCVPHKNTYDDEIKRDNSIILEP